MSYKRCDACRGQKKVKGLGCMLRKCETCNGTGYIEQDDVQDEQDIVEDVIADNADAELDIVDEKPKTKRKGNPNWRKKDAEA